MLDQGADIEIKEEDPLLKRRPLHIAAYKGYTNIVQLLLQREVNIESADALRQTALHWACRKGYEPIVQHLLAEGANIHVKTRFGHTPLYWAARGSQENIIKLLLTKGANFLEIIANEKQCQQSLLPVEIEQTIRTFYEQLKQKTINSYYLPTIQSTNATDEDSLVQAVLSIQDKWFLFYILLWQQLEKFLSHQATSKLTNEIKDEILNYLLVDVLIAHRISPEHTKIIANLLQYQWVNKENSHRRLESDGIYYIQCLHSKKPPVYEKISLVLLRWLTTCQLVQKPMSDLTLNNHNQLIANTSNKP